MEKAYSREFFSASCWKIIFIASHINLRMLLHKVCGPTSYEDLRSIDGVEYATFKEACYQRGYLAGDGEWDQCCLQEAQFLNNSDSLRELFVTILLFCAPESPLELFKKYWIGMSEDIDYNHRQTCTAPMPHDARQNSLLCTLQPMLARASSTLEKFGLPSSPDFNLISNATTNNNPSNALPSLIAEEMAHKTDSFLHNISSMNDDQKHVHDCIIDTLDKNTTGSKIYFVDAPGGTGKTFTFNTILASVRARGEIALAVASSGIAALLLVGGRTVHSRFKVPIPIENDSFCRIPAQSALADLIRRCKVIVWDEAPMASRYVLEAVERSIRDITQNAAVFGGKIVVLGGDFRQVLPVIARGTTGQIINACIKKSLIWRHVIVKRLTINERVRRCSNHHPLQSSNDSTLLAAYAEFLLSVGEGRLPKIPSSNREENLAILPPFITFKQGSTETDLIDWCYGSFTAANSGDLDPTTITSTAILTPTNTDSLELNQQVLNNFPGEEKEYHATDSVAIEDDPILYSQEFLNEVCISGLPPAKLKLKVNCPIILLRNLNIAGGLCNGTRFMTANYGHFLAHNSLLLIG